jgi:hypothetical protein
MKKMMISLCLKVSSNVFYFKDLDITPPHIIKRRILDVILFRKFDDDYLKEPDLTGPFILGLLLGILLMFTGRIHFNYIYGFGISGWIGIYFIMNFMSQVVDVSIIF